VTSVLRGIKWVLHALLNTRVPSCTLFSNYILYYRYLRRLTYGYGQIARVGLLFVSNGDEIDDEQEMVEREHPDLR